MPSFASSLRDARKAAGLTQKRASVALRKAGVSVSERAIAGYEREENEPDEIKQNQMLSALRNIAESGAGSSPVVSADTRAPVVTAQRDEATEDPLNPPGPRRPRALLFVLHSNNGPAVGWDMASNGWVQVGEPGHLDVRPEAAAVSSAPAAAASGSGALASSDA